MGSKLSRAVRPRPKVEASVAPTSHHDMEANNTPRQDPAPRQPALCHDDITVGASTTPRIISQRRNSAPFLSISTQIVREMAENLTLRASFEQFLAEQQLRSIDVEYLLNPTPPPPPAPVSLQPQTAQPSPEQSSQCLICCTELPNKTDLHRAKEVIKPCRSCHNEYCVSCVKKMFIDACKDMARMPPRCCVPINLHHAKPHLTEEEARLFRIKYDEWFTPNPFYCPVPVCSVFIPDRLLPHHVPAKDKPRVDSGIGTPNPEEFACPTCEAGICMQCRQPAHPGSVCDINEFGLDAETEALLKSWGYKKCPKCGHGLKRMFGCNHMECRCGAHFCWTCLENIDQCDGGCYEDEDGDEEDYNSEHESDVSDDDVPSTQPEAETQAAGNATAEAATQTSSDSTTPTATPSHAIPPRNLDGGGARYWASSAYDFGEEPSNDIQDRAWDCSHSFTEYKISFATALTSRTTEMECIKCWCTINPQLNAPQTQDKIVPASASRSRAAGVRRARERYVLPRGLFRADATIGMAPHLTTSISLLSQSVPGREASPMEDVRYSERIVDTYGNVIATTPLELKRRASFGTAPQEASKPVPSSFDKAASIFATSPPSIAFAHECSYCSILVCESCMKCAIAVQEAREEKETERIVAEERERERERADEARRVLDAADAPAVEQREAVPADEAQPPTAAQQDLVASPEELERYRMQVQRHEISQEIEQQHQDVLEHIRLWDASSQVVGLGRGLFE